MSASTVALAFPFWADVGLMERSENAHTPLAPVVAFNRAHEWNPDTAPQKLAPAFRETWFAKTLLLRLAFRTMEEREVLEILADQVSAGPEYRNQVKLLVEYMVITGLLERDGTQLKPSKLEIIEEKGTGTGDQRAASDGRIPLPNQRPSTSPNRIELDVRISVDMSEMAGWEPARITAFFSGLAQVLAAKGKD
jgi:hypothetical protein